MLRFLFFYFFDNFCRYASNYCVFRHILSNHCSSAITAFSPTITPGQMVALAPIQAFFLISTGFNSSSFVRLGFKPWLTERRYAPGPIETSSSMAMPPKSTIITLELIKTRSPILMLWP